MRFKFVGLVLLALVAALGATPALADSPHFLKASASINDAGALVCTFSEAGLGSTLTTERVTCTADASAVYFCLNGGGQNPNAANKRTVSGPVSGSGDFPVRNGRTNGSVTAGPIGPGDFTCPNGQTRTLSSVSYTNITLTGLAGDTASVPGTLSRTFFPIP